MNLPRSSAASSQPTVQGFRAWLQDWSELAKARLSLLVLLTTLVGLYCGSAGRMDPWRTLFTLLGTSLVAAAAAVLNEWLERDLDAKMKRTEDRPLPAGRISPDEALLGGAGMAGVGLTTLYFGVHAPAAFLAAATLALYLFVYTPMKRWSSLNTFVGAIPGAIPPLIGFSAGRGRIEFEGWALFSILFLWQIPHFMAIAWRYREDYRKAGFRMLPCTDEGGRLTGLVSVLYCLLLLPASLCPVYLEAAGWIYGAGALILGMGYTYFAGMFAWKPSLASARTLFLSSLLYLPLLLILLVSDYR
ncbi:MAG: heme o synthase [Verrucomicrobia bacterium]|nr:heme o synthase [Verrucomicrobiota bacterium]